MPTSVQTLRWNEAENSTLEEVWVFVLTQDTSALTQGEDTYMVRKTASL